MIGSGLTIKDLVIAVAILALIATACRLGVFIWGFIPAPPGGEPDDPVDEPVGSRAGARARQPRTPAMR